MSDLSDEKKVQSIVDEILGLSSQGISLDEAVDQRKRQAPTWFAQWASNFSIVDEVTTFFNDFSTKFTAEIWSSRDAASKTVVHISEFLEIMIPVVEDIKSKEELSDAVEMLKDFAAAKGPLETKPLNGFPAVNQSFTHVWVLVREEANHIVDVLEKAENISETIEILKEELGPVKAGCRQISAALDQYAKTIA